MDSNQIPTPGSGVRPRNKTYRMQSDIFGTGMYPSTIGRQRQSYSMPQESERQYYSMAQGNRGRQSYSMPQENGERQSYSMPQENSERQSYSMPQENSERQSYSMRQDNSEFGGGDNKYRADMTAGLPSANDKSNGILGHQMVVDQYGDRFDQDFGKRNGNARENGGNPLTGEGYNEVEKCHTQRRQFGRHKSTPLW